MDLTIFGIRGNFTGWVDSSMVAYNTASGTKSQYEQWNPNSDSSPSRYWHWYFTTTKSLRGWTKTIVELIGGNWESESRYAYTFTVYLKIINAGLAWRPGSNMYPSHDTWNYWRDCWVAIATLGVSDYDGYWYNLSRSYTKTIDSSWGNTVYGCDIYSQNNYYGERGGTVKVTFSK